MRNTDNDFSQGAAITSSFFPDAHTHIEPVRYGKGSNFMGLLQTLMTDGYSSKERRSHWVKQLLRTPSLVGKILNVRHWSERSVIALVMQDVNSSVTVKGKRGIFGFRLTSKNDPEHPNATYIPAANESVRAIAKEYGGIAAGHVGDLVDAPFTAHFVGGCVIGSDESKGVIDAYHRVFNYPTLHIVDGSTITANLGVNPSLTITAHAERAMSLWPNKDQADLRPVQGAGYEKIAPIAPNDPLVPIGAVGALFLGRKI
jgi:cholesterol oxidase